MRGDDVMAEVQRLKWVSMRQQSSMRVRAVVENPGVVYLGRRWRLPHRDTRIDMDSHSTRIDRMISPQLAPVLPEFYFGG